MELAIKGSAQTLSVSDAVFGRDFSRDLVHQVVVAFHNAARSGTKAQKTRAEVSGTTKKSKKQKGGGARHGALTAPIFSSATRSSHRPRPASTLALARWPASGLFSSAARLTPAVTCTAL